MTARLESRTPNTQDCPDERHDHHWRQRRPELTEGVDRFLTYSAEADGSVVLSEEVLAQLLRQAGYRPEVSCTEEARCWVHAEWPAELCPIHKAEYDEWREARA